MKLRFTISSFVFASALACLSIGVTTPSAATELWETQAPYFCDAPKSAGYIFYRFDKIVIFFDQIPGHRPPWPEPPAIFTFDSFVTRAENIVKEVFAPCLRTDSGKDKPVLAFGNGINTTPWAHVWEEVTDPRNVVLIVSLQYPYRPPESLEETTSDAVLTVTPFRAGLQPIEAYRATRAARILIIKPDSFEMKLPGALERELDKDLRSALKPYMNPNFTRDPSGEGLYAP